MLRPCVRTGRRLAFPLGLHRPTLSERALVGVRQESTQSLEHTSSDHAYFERRLEDTQAHFASKGLSYPLFQRDTTVAQFIATYDAQVANSQKLLDVRCKLAGRILSKRVASKNLYFYTLQDFSTGSTLQIMATRRNYESEQDFLTENELLRRGDVVGVEGCPARTNVGELSVVPFRLHLLAPCLHPLPEGQISKELRYKNRSMDLLLYEQSRNVFITRSKIIRFIRKFLDSRDFLEVETPILNLRTGGAAARPFVTHINALDMQLKMRIAPELFLKQLVVGGLERVYEIGKQFRNEGVDATHNPEFTTVEFYQAYADYEELMQLTETMLSEMALEICGTTDVPITVDGVTHTVSFKPPFRRLSLTSTLEERLGTALPRPEDEDCIDRMIDLCRQAGVAPDGPLTYAKLLDKLVGHLIEPDLIQPTFICEHPLHMSPLARTHRDPAKKMLTERFELFVATKEVCNAYTELNDPVEQRARFMQQHEDLMRGDDEAQEIDEGFCRSLEYGMPPTGGWGCGVDRLVMMLTGSQHIKEVLFFPLMKSQGLSAPSIETSAINEDQ